MGVAVWKMQVTGKVRERPFANWGEPKEVKNKESFVGFNQLLKFIYYLWYLLLEMNYRITSLKDFKAFF